MGNLLDKVDVLVIGGGALGSSVLRELSRYKYDIAMVEKNHDVCCGVSKAADGMQLEIGHEVGIRPDYKGMEMKTPIQDRCLQIAMFRRKALFKNLGIRYNHCGKMLVAFDDDELAQLKKCYRKVQWMGIPDVEFITDKSRILELEPNIAPEVIGALVLPTGIVYPWEVVIAFYENARQNNARSHFNAKVTNIVWQEDKKSFLVETERNDVETRFIVNAAQFGAAKIAGMIGDHHFMPMGTTEEFIILEDSSCEGLVRHTIREYGPDGLGKCLVIPTIDGEIFLGRGYRPVPSYEELNESMTTREGLEFVISETLKLVPSLPIFAAIKTFSGNVPGVKVRNNTNEWIPYAEYIIENSKANPRLINCVACAYGLSAGPGIGPYVVELLGYCGLDIGEARIKDDYNPIRPPLLRRFAEASFEKREKLIAKDPLYGNVVCRCKDVTEAEIVEAIRRGATSYQGIKYRTHTGMGKCQSGYDKPKVLEILARELAIPIERVTMKGGDSTEIISDSQELSVNENVKKVMSFVEPRFDSEELKKSYEELLAEMKP